ncbi:spermine oxidase-like [Lineus longissimus]|uniref:spermine oxidase-like n=1 Tax=Lineus longissimus TaxID=88925 RepID=UPI002B4EFC9F
MAEMEDLDDKMSPKILVIGAGIAGLATCDYLTKHGFTDFKVLEATSRTGGRIWSKNVDESCAINKNGMVELGANWIHGIERNPIYKIADEHDLLQLQRQGNLCQHSITVTENGESVPSKIVKEVDWEYGKLMQKTEEFFQHDMPTPYENDSVGSFLDREMEPTLKRYHGKDRKLRELIFWNRKNLETCISGCHSMEEVSLQEIGSYEELPGIHYTIPPGFEAILDILKKQIPAENLLMNHPVRTIHWNPKGEDVCVECENGSKFYASHVIVTISLGVLKEKARTLFNPFLPELKVDAINKLAIGVVDKVILEFDSPIVEPNLRNIQLLWDDIENDNADISESWVKKIHSFDVVQQTVLVGWLTGKEAMHMETLSEEVVGETCVKVLKKFLRRSDIPLPKKVIKTAWYSNPYTRGSYSFIPVGASIEDIEHLQEPLVNINGKPNVLFAGEATHTSFYSSTHGALLTGQREAETIVNYYMPNSDSSDHEYSASPSGGCKFLL